MSANAHVPASEAALLRALKRRVWSERWTFQAATAAGLEGLLEEEVAALLPDEPRERLSGQIRVEAPFDAVYALALRLRTADALRLRIAEEAAVTFPMLRDHLGRVAWRWWLPERCRLEVEVRSRRSRLRDDAGLERVVRQAVRAQGVDDAAKGSSAASLRVRLDLHRDRASVWLDVGGEPLHRRSGPSPGGRRPSGRRPSARRHTVAGAMRETTAAALAMLAGAEDADLILDPFCGSGTVLEEADAWARGRCPGAERSFAMAASPAWNAARMRHAERTHCAEERGPGPLLVGRDVADEAIAAAGHNLARIDHDRVDLARADARDLDLPALRARTGATRPILLANPPYGRRAAAHGADPAALLAQVLAAAAGWRFGLAYPDPDAVAALPGVQVERVVRFRMRGLPNALLSGSIRERVTGDSEG